MGAIHMILCTRFSFCMLDLCKSYKTCSFDCCRSDSNTSNNGWFFPICAPIVFFDSISFGWCYIMFISIILSHYSRIFISIIFMHFSQTVFSPWRNLHLHGLWKLPAPLSQPGERSFPQEFRVATPPLSICPKMV